MEEKKHRRGKVSPAVCLCLTSKLHSSKLCSQIVSGNYFLSGENQRKSHDNKLHIWYTNLTENHQCSLLSHPRPPFSLQVHIVCARKSLWSYELACHVLKIFKLSFVIDEARCFSALLLLILLLSGSFQLTLFIYLSLHPLSVKSQKGAFWILLPPLLHGVKDVKKKQGWKLEKLLFFGFWI